MWMNRTWSGRYALGICGAHGVSSRWGRPKVSIRHMNGVTISAPPSAQTTLSSGRLSKTPSAIMFIRW